MKNEFEWKLLKLKTVTFEIISRFSRFNGAHKFDHYRALNEGSFCHLHSLPWLAQKEFEYFLPLLRAQGYNKKSVPTCVTRCWSKK